MVLPNPGAMRCARRYGAAMRTIVGLLLAAGAAAAIAPAAAPAASTKTCPIPPVESYPYPGPNGSWTRFKATRASCATSYRVATAFQRCRLKNGVSGRCVKKVADGWACGEIRSNGPTSFGSTVTCRKGRAIVRHSYTQTTAG